MAEQMADMKRSFRPIFIVGCPRSGTTLLSVLLDRHSALAITPETAFYDEIAPQLDTRAAHRRPPAVHAILNAWPRLAELGLTVGEVMDAARPSALPADLLASMMALYATACGKSQAGEKTPQHLRHAARILSDFPDSHVVCLMRDGRDVTLSLAAMPWWQGGLPSAAAAWCTAAATATALAGQFPSRFHLVRYEHLVCDPALVMGPLMALQGLAFEPAQLTPSPQSPVVLPRSLQWKGHALEAVDAGRAQWRRAATDRATWAALQGLLGPTLAIHGYA